MFALIYNVFCIQCTPRKKSQILVRLRLGFITTHRRDFINVHKYNVRLNVIYFNYNLRGTETYFFPMNILDRTIVTVSLDHCVKVGDSYEQIFK